MKIIICIIKDEKSFIVSIFCNNHLASYIVNKTETSYRIKRNKKFQLKYNMKISFCNFAGKLILLLWI